MLPLHTLFRLRMGACMQVDNFQAYIRRVAGPILNISGADEAQVRPLAQASCCCCAPPRLQSCYWGV